MLAWYKVKQPHWTHNICYTEKYTTELNFILYNVHSSEIIYRFDPKYGTKNPTWEHTVDPDKTAPLRMRSHCHCTRTIVAKEILR